MATQSYSTANLPASLLQPSPRPKSPAPASKRRRSFAKIIGAVVSASIVVVVSHALAKGDVVEAIAATGGILNFVLVCWLISRGIKRLNAHFKG